MCACAIAKLPEQSIIAPIATSISTSISVNISINYCRTGDDETTWSSTFIPDSESNHESDSCTQTCNKSVLLPLLLAGSRPVRLYQMLYSYQPNEPIFSRCVSLCQLQGVYGAFVHGPLEVKKHTNIECEKNFHATIWTLLKIYIWNVHPPPLFTFLTTSLVNYRITTVVQVGTRRYTPHTIDEKNMLYVFYKSLKNMFFMFFYFFYVFCTFLISCFCCR